MAPVAGGAWSRWRAGRGPGWGRGPGDGRGEPCCGRGLTWLAGLAALRAGRGSLCGSPCFGKTGINGVVGVREGEVLISGEQGQPVPSRCLPGAAPWAAEDVPTPRCLQAELSHILQTN